jgi:hypothetical protein
MNQGADWAVQEAFMQLPNMRQAKCVDLRATMDLFARYRMQGKNQVTDGM